MQPLDQYIKEQLHIKYMTRYMDDIVIFGSSKKEIHKAVRAIRDCLKGNFNLEMKDNWQVFRLEYECREAAITCSTLKELAQLDESLSAMKIKHKNKMHKKKRKIFIAEQVLIRKKEQIDVLHSHTRAGFRTLMHTEFLRSG